MPEERDIRDLHEDAGVVVLFRSVLTRKAGPDYESMHADMVTLAREMPGFVDYRNYVSQDGERLSVIWWDSHEGLAKWRDHSQHRFAQRYGKETWYAWYRIEIADRLRGYAFDRNASDQ